MSFRHSLACALAVAGVAAYGLAKWREDGFAGRFATENEGWFGQDTRYGGADRAGHAYSVYFGVRVVSALLQSYGNDRRHSGDLAFGSTLGTLAAVEVADGFSKQYKFSAQDFAMNVVGAAFGWCAERDPAVDDLLDFRLHCRPSSDSDSWDAFGDYPEQRFMLVAKVSSVPQLRDNRWPAAKRATDVVLDLWQIPGTGVHVRSTL